MNFTHICVYWILHFNKHTDWIETLIMMIESNVIPIMKRFVVIENHGIDVP